MPIQRCTLEGGGQGWKWGESGHCYPTRAGALRQMRAIKSNQAKGEESLMEKADKIICENAEKNTPKE